MTGCASSTAPVKPEFSPLPSYVQREALRPCIRAPRSFGRIQARDVKQAQAVRRWVAQAVRSDCDGRRALRGAVGHFNAHAAAFGKDGN